MASSTDTHDAILNLDTPESYEDAVGNDGLVLVDFYADWCGPCKQMEPVLEAIAGSTEAQVLKVDVDQHQQLAAEYQVRGVPTMLVYKDGEQVERFVGYQPEPALRETVSQYSN